jgi:hypothetical protein
MTYTTVRGVLAAAVATGGTFTVGYPTGKTRGDFSLGVRSALSVIGTVFTAPEDMTLSFGASSVTVTYNGSTTLPIGTPFTFQFDNGCETNDIVEPVSGQSIGTPTKILTVNLGSPGTADADGYYASAALTASAGTGQALTGALVSGGVGVADARCGRNVVAAWTGTAVLTVRGYDMYGNPMTESSASGTSFTGVKAFKRVTSIQVSADVTALTVGTGVVLGLPIHLPNAAMILKESLNGAAATAGTTVAALALTTKPTATNADVRGTYNPNSAPDGSRAYTLLVASQTPTFLGAEQYTA